MNEENKDFQQEQVQEQQPDTSHQEEAEQGQAPLPNESFKEARERIKRQEDEIYHLRRQQEYYMSQLQQQNNAKQAPQEPDFDINSLPDDDLLDTGSYKKDRRKTQDEIAQLKQDLIRSRMSAQFKDYDQVCTQENAAKLEQIDPDIAETILLQPSYEKKLKMIYREIKRQGIYKDAPSKEKEEIAGYNTTRPKSVSSARSSQSTNPLSKAGAFSGRLTEEMKRQIYKEALEKARTRR